MTDSSQYFTRTQSVVLAMIPKVTSMLSFWGSTCIILEVLGDKAQTKSDTMNRIFICMSITDMFMSIAWFLSTWPVPAADSSNPNNNNVLAFSSGTVQSCTFQGTFFLFGNVASALYVGTLALCYMLRIKCRWTNSQLQKLETRVLHPIALGIPCVMMILSLALGLFNSQLYICRVNASPVGCEESYLRSWRNLRRSDTYAEEAALTTTTPCSRGDNATIYSYLFSSIWIWMSFAVTCISMVLMCTHVRNIERNSVVYRKRGSVKFMKHYNRDRKSRKRAIAKQMKKSRALVRQATWFIGTYMVTQLPDTLTKAVWDATQRQYLNFWLLLIVNILLSMRGLMNFIVFNRTRTSISHPITKALRKVLFIDGSLATSFMSNGTTGTERTNNHLSEMKQEFVDLLSTSVTNGRTVVRGINGSIHGMLGSWHGSWQHRREALPEGVAGAGFDEDARRGSGTRRRLRQLLSASRHGSQEGSIPRGSLNSGTKHRRESLTFVIDQQRQGSRGKEEGDNHYGAGSMMAAAAAAAAAIVSSASVASNDDNDNNISNNNDRHVDAPILSVTLGQQDSNPQSPPEDDYNDDSNTIPVELVTTPRVLSTIFSSSHLAHNPDDISDDDDDNDDNLGHPDDEENLNRHSVMRHSSSLPTISFLSRERRRINHRSRSRTEEEKTNLDEETMINTTTTTTATNRRHRRHDDHHHNGRDIYHVNSMTTASTTDDMLSMDGRVFDDAVTTSGDAAHTNITTFGDIESGVVIISSSDNGTSSAASAGPKRSETSHEPVRYPVFVGGKDGGGIIVTGSAFAASSSKTDETSHPIPERSLTFTRPFHMDPQFLTTRGPCSIQPISLLSSSSPALCSNSNISSGNGDSSAANLKNVNSTTRGRLRYSI